MKKKEEVKLNTDVIITYDKKGNIKSCVSPFDKSVTNKPLP